MCYNKSIGSIGSPAPMQSVGSPLGERSMALYAPGGTCPMQGKLKTLQKGVPSSGHHLLAAKFPVECFKRCCGVGRHQEGGYLISVWCCG